MENRIREKRRNPESDLENVNALNGLVPICASCKRIRDDDGYWHLSEDYIRTHSDVKFSHGICPECFKKMYPEFEEMKKKIDPDEKDHEQSN